LDKINNILGSDLTTDSAWAGYCNRKNHVALEGQKIKQKSGPRVGIPRALFYYHFFPQWKRFFENLGWEVQVSPPTNKAIANEGIAEAVSEACFPVKVHYGHSLYLSRQGVDLIFAPRLISIERRSYICPKFMGIPDMLRAQIKSLPPLFDISIDLSQGSRHLNRQLRQWALETGLSPHQVEQAWQQAERETDYLNSICRAGFRLGEAIRIWEGHPMAKKGPAALNIGVLGHCYTLNDSFVNLNLFGRLQEMGVNAVTVEMADPDLVHKAADQLPKRVFWTVGRDLVGGALVYDRDPAIDGIIYMTCFGCGPDSMVAKVIERRMKKPFMLLTVDEHSGEAGLITRLEAFCDMLRRRRDRVEDNISPHGKFSYSH